jgi:hypothetical protein
MNKTLALGLLIVGTLVLGWLTERALDAALLP